MSMMHSIVFHMCKQGKRRYSPEKPQDYPAQRAAEIRQNRFVTVPGAVCVRETSMDGVPVELLSHPKNPGDQIVLYLHGGGFVVGSVKTRRVFTAYVANKLGCNVAAPEYRLAPEHPFPAAAQDCFAVYRKLLKEYALRKIVLLGESAGGNLVLSVLLQIKAAGLPMPAAALCLSPCVQFDQTFPSHMQNQKTEAMVDNLSEEVCRTYLCSWEETVIRNPLGAPYYGDFTGCPPICLWASESEVLRDDSVFFYEKLRKEGNPCRLYLRKGMLHTWLIIPHIPEARRDLKTVKACMDAALNGTLRGESGIIHLEECHG